MLMDPVRGESRLGGLLDATQRGTAPWAGPELKKFCDCWRRGCVFSSESRLASSPRLPSREACASILHKESSMNANGQPEMQFKSTQKKLSPKKDVIRLGILS